MKAFLNRTLLLALSALALAGCGGRGDDSTDTVDPTTPTASSLELISSTSSLRSSGADKANLIAIVKDSSNVVLKDAVVNFQTTSGSLSVLQPTTDDAGQAKAELATSNDPSNRTITVTATVNGTSINDTVTIDVTGTTLVVSGPAAIGQGGVGDLSINLKDADGVGLANQTVSLSSSLSNSLSSSSLTTNAQGIATATVTATNGGTDTITARAFNDTVQGTHSISISNQTFSLAKTSPTGDIPLNTSGVVALTWTVNGAAQSGQAITFTTTRGTVSSAVVNTNASGVATTNISATTAGKALITATAGSNSTSLEVEFVAVSPATIVVDASPKTVGPNAQTSTITAVVRDVNSNVVKGQTVSFAVNDPSGGTINPAAAITDSSGQASTTYTSNATTAQDGVTVTGSISGTGLSDDVKLTVAQSSLFITLGTGNKLETDADEVSYIKKYLVFVTDVNGNARPNQVVNLSVVPVLSTQSDGVAYNKGLWVAGVETWVTDISAQCQNEDINQNGRLDAGEDTNGDGLVTPANVVSIGSGSSATGEVTTDASGYATVSLRYAKEYGAWVQVRLRASATVAGTESYAIKDFLLQVLADDVKLDAAPPGRTFSDGSIGSPFGRSDTCVNAL